MTFLTNPVRWFVRTLAVYMAVAFAAGALFVAGAAIYAALT